MEEKHCSTCNKTKSVKDFGKDKNRSDGLSFYCKQCNAERAKAYVATHHDLHLSRVRSYYAAHCEEISERAAAYRSENREKILAVARAYYAENREKCIAKSSAYQTSHKEERRAYQQEHREEIRARKRAYRAARREAFRARGAKYYAKNREERLKKVAAYAAAHHDKILAYQKAWYSSHRDDEEYREARRKWARDNPESGRENSRRRRARKNGAPVLSAYTTSEALAGRSEMYGGLCYICGAVATDMDHVKPLAKGGAHVPCNLRPICKSCNSKKGAKWPYDAE
jgi:5-methylcytosine-specific restriction endonuclease McrA